MDNRVKFGVSVYLSSFQQQKTFLEKIECEGVYIFTSFHITEEMQDLNGKVIYKNKTMEMLDYLKSKNFKIIADISRRTLDIFGCETIEILAQKLDIDVIRIDYGFTLDEIREASKSVRLAINASTVTEEEARAFIEVMDHPIAIHNYYPRPETGLGKEIYESKTKMLRKIGFDIGTFIPGNLSKRGPIKEGLPTLEHQRFSRPYVNFMEVTKHFKSDIVLLADLDMDVLDYRWISDYINEGIVSVPIKLNEAYCKLYNQTFTIREDSGAFAYRFKESREYSMSNDGHVSEENCTSRERGTLTIDNHKYARYAGEIQLIFKDLPKDERVNVIGHVDEGYREIVEFIVRNDKVKLVRF